jgi:DNA-directed RNA polymerase specialized sigma24 family protein
VKSSTDGRVDVDLERDLEQHRRELTGYCYRMLGSPHELRE